MRCDQPRAVDRLLKLGADPKFSAERFTAAVDEISSYGFTKVLAVLKKHKLLDTRGGRATRS
jgi:hypothetical protein